MTLGTPPNIHFPQMTSLINGISKSTKKLESILLGDPVNSDEYKKVVKKMWNKNWIFSNARERRFALAALYREDGLLKNIGQQYNQIASQIFSERDSSLAIQTLRLFYAKFWTLDELKILPELQNNLKSVLINYQGKNSFVLKAKNDSMIPNANFSGLLQKHNEKKLSEIADHYKYSPTDEFYSQLQLSKILTHFQNLEFGKTWTQIFDEAKAHKNRLARTIDNRLIGEEVAAILLTKSKYINTNPPQNWQDLILELVGDPRSNASNSAWNRIGSELRAYFSGLLSKSDLKEFLESISDGSGDDVYIHRKRFWIRYIHAVRNARLLICQRDFDYLKTSNPEMRNRFETHSETYGKLSRDDDKGKSYIFIDFGNLKVIEGTHKTSIRFYQEMPSWFKNNKYQLIDNRHINKIPHHSKDNSWQREAQQFLGTFGIYPQG